MDALRILRIIVALFSSVFLLSCSSGGSDTVAGGGIGGSGYVGVGTVTEFGSIVVNGVRLDTTNALVFIGGKEMGMGDQAIRDNLKLGHVVIVEGILNEDGTSGSAARVMFTPHVRGPVTQITDIDATAKKLIVLSQTIIIDDNSTVFTNTSFENLSLNNFVEVSGMMDTSGELRATYLKKVADSFDPSMECQVKGTVQKINVNGNYFSINALVVYYGAADVSRLPGGAPAEGQLVHVRGTVDTGNRLIAQEIEPADENSIANARRLDIDGFIAAFSSISDFTVGYVKVSAQGNTRYKGGVAEELEAGTRILVRSALVNGVLVAEQISFRDQAKLESSVVDKNTVQRTLSLRGLGGITVTFTDLTKIGGFRHNFDEIQVGDYIRARGREIGNSSVVRAARAQVIPSSDVVILQGFVDSVGGSQLTVLSITVDSTLITNFGGMSRTEFFNIVKPGSLVKIKGKVEPSGVVSWEEIAIEDNI
jgi:hypothetical protein